MIQDSVRTSLFGLVGWRQDTTSNIPTVSAANLASTTGLYFQDFSSLITLRNVYKCQEDTDITDGEFNTFLTNLTKAAIWKILNAVFSDNDFIENKVLYPFENSFNDTITNGSNFVGYEIKMPKRKDISWKINTVFTTFNGSDSVKILLFHSSKKTPIQTETISTTEDSEDSTTLSWDLNQFDYAGGKYYIGYLQGGLTASAYNREWNKSNVQDCFNTIKFEPVSISHTSETLFDVEDLDYEDETFGLNFDVTAYKDYSNIVVQNKHKFSNAIGLQVAADVLDLILKSVRSNRIERITEGQVLFELEGLIAPELPRSLGIAKRLKSEIESLRANFVNEQKITRGTIG
jgi:hypothetical protein